VGGWKCDENKSK